MNKDLIIEVEPILSYIIRGIEFSYSKGKVNFGSGEERDLLEWFNVKQKSINKSKYPLIWYEPQSVTTTQEVTYIINDARFIICALTDKEWLRETRYFKNYKEFLTKIANELYIGLDRSKNINFRTKNSILKYTYLPKYHVFDDKNPQGDVVDAIEIILDIEINTNCIIKENLESCQIL